MKNLRQDRDGNPALTCFGKGSSLSNRIRQSCRCRKPQLNFEIRLPRPWHRFRLQHSRSHLTAWRSFSRLFLHKARLPATFRASWGRRCRSSAGRVPVFSCAHILAETTNLREVLRDALGGDLLALCIARCDLLQALYPPTQHRHRRFGKCVRCIRACRNIRSDGRIIRIRMAIQPVVDPHVLLAAEGHQC
jgi:hypothetical protein